MKETPGKNYMLYNDVYVISMRELYSTYTYL